MNKKDRELAIAALASLDELMAGLRDNEAGAIDQAKEILHGMTDDANAAQLSVLLTGVKCMNQMIIDRNK